MGRQRRHLSLCFLFTALIFLTWNATRFPGIKVRPSPAEETLLLPSNSSTKKTPTIVPASFSARAAAFFGSRPPCESRFLMTWISKTETMGERELLSVESVFKFHPQSCLLILSSSMDSPAGSRLLSPLTSLGFRVASIAPDYTGLLRQTPARLWLSRLRQGRLFPGEIPLGQNLSNLLRLAALHKFGGIYLDSDVIVVRPFAGLRNVIGAQSLNSAGNWSRLNNAVLVFDKKHPLLAEFMREFVETFDGNRWGHNGPYLVSRVVERARRNGRAEGVGVQVAPPAAFYPVSWNRVGGLFKSPEDTRQERWVQAKLDSISRASFAVHLWNRCSRGLQVEDRSLLARILAASCLLCNYTSAAASNSL